MINLANINKYELSRTNLMKYLINEEFNVGDKFSARDVEEIYAKLYSLSFLQEEPYDFEKFNGIFYRVCDIGISLGILSVEKIKKMVRYSNRRNRMLPIKVYTKMKNFEEIDDIFDSKMANSEQDN